MPKRWVGHLGGLAACATPFVALALAEAASPDPIPPHTARPVPGLHAYTAHSVIAGQPVRFHVSSTVDYRFSLVRLGADPHTTDQDIVLSSVEAPASSHPIHPGSYVHVPSLAGFHAEEVTLGGWIRPFRTEGEPQGIISLLDRPEKVSGGGWTLMLENGALALEWISPNGQTQRLASGIDTVRDRTWQHVAATWDASGIRLWIDAEPVAHHRPDPAHRPGPPSPDTPLRLGSSGRVGHAADFLDADIAGFVLLHKALESDAIRLWVSGQGALPDVDPTDITATWTFTEETGMRVADTSGRSHHGQVINEGTWMVGGPGFDASRVGRFDTAYDPDRDVHRGHALRLSRDDLHDCRWPVAHEVVLPDTTPPGLHCGRFEFERDGTLYQQNVTFVVRRPPSQPRASILVLAAANTWRAYNWFPFAANLPPGRHDWGQGSVARRNPDHDLPAHCFYRDHRAGQPTYQVGLRLPCPSADPYRTYRGHSLWGQWVANERLVHLWLERHGYAYDVVTDMDLDAQPDLLDGRNTLFIVGHSEYWSDPAYDAVEAFLSRGGHVVVLSANTMFWRVDLDTPGILGGRKLGKGMLGSRWTTTGEIYHGRNKARGGLMRFSGRPAWKLIGLETAGWGVGMDFLPYTRTHPDHPLFQHPLPVTVRTGETFGYFHGIGMVGHEYDVRPSILVSATPRMPPGHEDVADPPGITVLAQSLSDRKIIDYWAIENLASENPTGVLSEIILWQRPGGGEVFNIGSVAAPWGLYYDDSVDRLVRNVLHHFGEQPGPRPRP